MVAVGYLDSGLTQKLLLILVPLVCVAGLSYRIQRNLYGISVVTLLQTGNVLDPSFSSRCICIELLEVV